jgi:hypothetical protein
MAGWLEKWTSASRARLQTGTFHAQFESISSWGSLLGTSAFQTLSPMPNLPIGLTNVSNRPTFLYLSIHNCYWLLTGVVRVVRLVANHWRSVGACLLYVSGPGKHMQYSSSETSAPGSITTYLPGVTTYVTAIWGFLPVKISTLDTNTKCPIFRT